VASIFHDVVHHILFAGIYIRSAYKREAQQPRNETPIYGKETKGAITLIVLV
jgi:hypothetical protein